MKIQQIYWNVLQSTEKVIKLFENYTTIVSKAKFKAKMEKNSKC